MFDFLRRRPGGIDDAARRIRDLLDREEREKLALRRLQAAGWRPPAGADTAPRERRFGDGRDDLMQLVQSDLDRRQALQDEARRRAQLAQSGATVPIPPRKPAAPLPGSAGSDLPYAPINQGRNVNPQDRAKFRGALDARKSLSPAMRSIFDHVFDFEGGYKRTPGGSAVTGITQETLDDYLDEFYRNNPEVHSAWHGKRFTPAELSDDQRIAFMQWYADNNMGEIDVGEIESPRRPKSYGDPKLAGLLFDSMYRYGKGIRDDGKGQKEDLTHSLTGRLQRAINDTLSRYWSDANLRGARTPSYGSMPKTIMVDGGPGPETRDTIRQLLDAGYAGELRAAINRQIHEMNITPTAKEAKDLEREGKDPTRKEEKENDAYRRSVFR